MWAADETKMARVSEEDDTSKILIFSPLLLEGGWNTGSQLVVAPTTSAPQVWPGTPIPPHAWLTPADHAAVPAVPTPGPPPHVAGSPEVSYDAMARVWHKPMVDAAAELGVSKYKLKAACEKYGVTRWPYRKIHCLHVLLEEMTRVSACSADIDHVQRVLAAINEDPNTSLDATTKRWLQHFAKARFNQCHERDV